MNFKGQESAPFELLIAVIVMTFVILVGFNALDRLQTETCKGELNQDMENIKSSIEAVVKNKSKANVSFELPGCFNENESQLRIIERDSVDYCSAVCGGSISSCTVLQFSNPYHTNTKCLRISSATNFPQGQPCNADLLEGDYSIHDWKSISGGITGDADDGSIQAGTITPGRYTLIRQSNLFTSAPVICVYKRERG